LAADEVEACVRAGKAAIVVNVKIIAGTVADHDAALALGSFVLECAVRGLDLEAHGASLDRFWVFDYGFRIALFQTCKLYGVELGAFGVHPDIMRTQEQILAEYRGYRRACIYALIGILAVIVLQVCLLPWPGSLIALVFLVYTVPACYGIWRWRGLQSEIRNPKSAITAGGRA
jgi:hypothetical protein